MFALLDWHQGRTRQAENYQVAWSCFDLLVLWDFTLVAAADPTLGELSRGSSNVGLGFIFTYYPVDSGLSDRSQPYF